MNLIDALANEFDREVATTLPLLEMLPEDKLAWKPQEKAMTLAELTGHLAEMLEWSGAMIGMDTFEMDPSTHQPFVPASRAELLDKYQSGAAQTRQLLAGLTPEALDATWTMTIHGKTVISESRYSTLRTWLFNHLIHHRAQVGVYYRILGLTLPTIYGNTAENPGDFA